MFVTPAEPNDAIWYVTQCDPVIYQVEMIKITPEHAACRLNIQLESDGANGTRATVSYEFTSLGEGGDVFVTEFDEQAWLEFMQAWECELNHYLETGGKPAA